MSKPPLDEKQIKEFDEKIFPSIANDENKYLDTIQRIMKFPDLTDELKNHIVDKTIANNNLFHADIREKLLHTFSKSFSQDFSIQSIFHSEMITLTRNVFLNENSPYYNVDKAEMNMKKICENTKHHDKNEPQAISLLLNIADNHRKNEPRKQKSLYKYITENAPSLCADGNKNSDRLKAVRKLREINESELSVPRNYQSFVLSLK